jgi:hypothetical protein
MADLNEEQLDRLQALMAKRTDPTDPALPGLTDEEAEEALVLAFGLDPVTAAEITAIERGQIAGDVIEE